MPDAVASLQKTDTSDCPDDLVRIEGFGNYQDCKIWDHEGPSDLQLQLCINTHRGSVGHHGRKVTESALRSRNHWSTITDEFQTFVQVCIRFLLTGGGEEIPRPFVPVVQEATPNDLVRFNWISIGSCRNGDMNRTDAARRPFGPQVVFLLSKHGHEARRPQNHRLMCRQLREWWLHVRWSNTF